MTRIAVIPGDGIGVEVIAEALKVLRTLADLTGKNANVFYEVGICHALDKPVLLMAQSMDDVPFDLRHRRVLIYEYTPRGVKRLEKALTDHLKAMLQKTGPEGLQGEHKAV